MNKIKIGEKWFEVKQLADGGSEAGAETTAPETEVPAVETSEEALDAAAEKIIAKLGLGDIHAKLDALAKKGTETGQKKISALMDLEALMKKDVGQMTSKEKIVGFFQAMLQNNEPVLKALSEGSSTDGGYLFPDDFRYEIIRDIADSSYYMRSQVTVIPMQRDVMNIPTLASRPQVTWTNENAVKSTTTAHFGQVTLTVKKMAAILYASDELIDDSSNIDIVNFIIGLFSEAIGQEEDRVIWRGNSSTEPTGVVTAKGNGVIATLSGATGLSIDLLISLMGLLPQKYHANAKFWVNRNNITELRKMKDANGRYYWIDPITAGSLPLFNGYPVVEINYLPESEIYFGDMAKAYWLGDRQKMTVKISQDTETAFTKDQTAIRVVSRIAGNVVLGFAMKGLVALP